MYIPDVMEIVRLTSMDEIYLVTRVDYEAQLADLLPVFYGKLPVPAVPFFVIEAMPFCAPPLLTVH